MKLRPSVKAVYVTGSLVWKHSSASFQLCAVAIKVGQPVSLLSAPLDSICKGVAWIALMDFNNILLFDDLGHKI